ncbi:MAG: oxygen-independent coproporphyrinogen III oxidase [Geminicoccaceae bacterium]
MHPSLARYAELRVPRYTSYPPASCFGPSVDAARAAEWLAALDPGATLSLYLHVPFCKKVCWYCACNMKLAAREDPVRAYGDVLRREVALVAAHLPGRMAVTSLHWGGGTPHSMPLDALAAISSDLRAAFAFRPEAEIAFEIDPRTFTAEMAEGIAGLGATRASLGVQEFDPQVQAAVNRIQPFDVVAATVARLRAAGIRSINFDLMYGLPHQTTDSLARTVAQAASLAPDRIALFGYAHVPWMAKNQRMLPEAALPDAAGRFAQAETAAELLVRHGYGRIGLDHFARPGDAMAEAAKAGRLSRNFQGYTVDPADALIGLGATAISSLPRGYVQNIGETRAHGRAVEEGRLPVARGHALAGEDQLRRAVIERLLCALSVDLDAVAEAHGYGCGHFAPELAHCRRFVEEGLAEIDGGRLTVLERGRPALRVIASQFDQHLTLEAGQRKHAVAI